MKYRKRPVIIDAVKWDGNLDELEELGPFQNAVSLNSNDLKIETLEGEMIARIGDYVIRGVKAELYPCKPDIFEATYESA